MIAPDVDGHEAILRYLRTLPPHWQLTPWRRPSTPTTAPTASRSAAGSRNGRACAFLLGTILLVFADRHWIWWLGLAFQLFVYVAYVQVSGIRNPPFEFGGISLRIIELPLAHRAGIPAVTSIGVDDQARMKAGR